MVYSWVKSGTSRRNSSMQHCHAKCGEPGSSGKPSAPCSPAFRPATAAFKRWRAFLMFMFSALGPRPGCHLSTHQRHEAHEADFRIDFYFEILIKAFRLAISDENEETIAGKCLQRPLVLFLPVDLPLGPQLVAIEHALRLGWLDQPAKIFRLPLIVILHLLINARPNQLSHRKPLRQAFERESVSFVSRRGFIVDGQVHSDSG